MIEFEKRGLSPSAREIVKEAKREESSARFSMIGVKGSFPLYKYTLPNNKILFESVQAIIMESTKGPMLVFIALQDEKSGWIPASLWMRKQVALPPSLR